MDKSFWDQKYSGDEYVYTTEVNSFVKEHLANLTPGKMIDLAGGEGRNTVYFAEKGWQAENIDLSGVGLAKCEKLAAERNVSERVFTTQASALDFESKLAPVDLGLVGYLHLNHDDLRTAIALLLSCMVPGGTLFGVWHALENLKDGFGGPQDARVLPSVESMTEILGSLPVNVQFITNRNGQVQTQQGLKPSITLTALATKL